ncbi:MAG: serine/threonine-protein kinase [Terriglobales bacterium]
MRTPVNSGDKLDHYLVEEVVARSGTVSVFRGIDLDTSQPVAIKIPHPEMESDPTFFNRFRREEEIVKSLDHPGIMKVFAEDGRAQNYIVMEWFEGATLRRLLDGDRKLAPDRAVRIALSICEVLDYIQNHGVVHRDLKPQNVMIDAIGHVKLIGFGVATQAGARRITFTNLSQVVGTTEYVSPEELKGKRGDARSDIYSLGVMLYEMLTGRTPFPGVDPFERILRHPIPPREIDPSISPQLQEVIYRALEREPKNRYANARDFARDLEHLARVGVADRLELREWKKQRKVRSTKILAYVAVALVPILIFSLLLYFALH